jgi:Fur family peroxide stress response transcriptional regulator
VAVGKREVERRVGRFKEVARQAGVKLTPQRLEIFREVAASLEHPSAEVVLKAVQPRMPTVSLDTVYRTLWLLNDLGLVSTLGTKHECVRFDANLSHHHHFVCTRCGLTRDFESKELDELRLPKSVKDLGSVVGMHVEVLGVCGRCSRKKAAVPGSTNSRKPRGWKRGTS